MYFDTLVNKLFVNISRSEFHQDFKHEAWVSRSLEMGIHITFHLTQLFQRTHV